VRVFTFSSPKEEQWGAERETGSAFKAAKIIHPSPPQSSPDIGNIEILVGQSVRIRLSSVCDSSGVRGLPVKKFGGAWAADLPAGIMPA